MGTVSDADSIEDRAKGCSRKEGPRTESIPEKLGKVINRETVLRHKSDETCICRARFQSFLGWRMKKAPKPSASTFL